MNLAIKATLRLDEALNRKISMFGPAFKRRIMWRVSRELLSMTQANFGSSGLYRPSPWPPLSKKYQKRIKYFGPPKLVLKGPLLSSLTASVPNENTAEVSSTVVYAAAHQFGVAQNNLPPRPFFPIVSKGGSWQPEFGFIGTATAGGYRLTPVAQYRVKRAIEQGLNDLLSR